MNNGDQDLVIVTLRGSDGKEDHCVTLYGPYIFDSNFDHALPLTKEALDLCCSSDESQDTFESFVEARWFHHFKHMLKKSAPKGKKRK